LFSSKNWGNANFKAKYIIINIIDKRFRKIENVC